MSLPNRRIKAIESKCLHTGKWEKRYQCFDSLFHLPFLLIDWIDWFVLSLWGTPSTVFSSRLYFYSGVLNLHRWLETGHSPDVRELGLRKLFLIVAYSFHSVAQTPVEVALPKTKGSYLCWNKVTQDTTCTRSDVTIFLFIYIYISFGKQETSHFFALYSYQPIRKLFNGVPTHKNKN